MKEKLSIGLAILALIVALSVAMFGGNGSKLGGTTNLDIVQVDEAAFNNASTTNLLPAFASTTQYSYLKSQKLYLASGQYMDSFYNDTGVVLHVPTAFVGFNDGTASSSIKISLFATTTGPSKIKALYTYTTLTDAINGAGTFLVREYPYATSSTATTTDSLLAQNQGNGKNFIDIPIAGYLHFLVQQGDMLIGCSVNKTCESATSTNRGIGDYFAQFLYVR